MIVRAVVIVLRKDGFFHTGDAIVYRNYRGFKGFPYRRVEAVRKGSGYGVALVLQPSQIDSDFGVPTLFLTAEHLKTLEEAFDKSDHLTHKLLGHGWNGPRPFWKLEDFCT